MVMLMTRPGSRWKLPEGTCEACGVESRSHLLTRRPLKVGLGAATVEQAGKGE